MNLVFNIRSYIITTNYHLNLKANKSNKQYITFHMNKHIVQSTKSLLKLFGLYFNLEIILAQVKSNRIFLNIVNFDLLNFRSISSQRRTSLTNLRWKAFTSGLSWNEIKLCTIYIYIFFTCMTVTRMYDS